MDKEYLYHGRKIVIAEGGASPYQPVEHKLIIDGEHIPVHFVPGTGKFVALAHSPYLDHDTLDDLAKHVADHVIAKRSR